MPQAIAKNLPQARRSYRRMFQEEASHPATSAQRLEMLCEDPHLRIMVADNPAAPADLLARLATAHFAGVAQGQRLTPLIWFLGRA